MNTQSPHQTKSLWCRFSLLILTICLLYPRHSVATDIRPDIYWMQVDWQPSWIFDGPMRGQGYGQLIESALTPTLPDFNHLFIETTFTRMVTWLGKRPDVCSSTGFYQWPNPETGQPRKDLVWSAPVLMFEWHGMVINSKDAKGFPAERPLVLTKFLANTDKVMILQHSRDLGPRLNPVVEPYYQTEKILLRGGANDSTTSLYKMISLGRADYTIDYRFMVNFANSIEDDVDMMFIPLKEHQGKYGYGAVVCTNSPLGEAVVKAVNKQIKELRGGPLRNINARWFAPYDDDTDFWRQWHEEFLGITE